VYLTKHEERIYDGEHGWAEQVSMKILVRLGELFNATKLIPIQSAHVAGVSYKTLGDAGAEFLQAMADAGGKTKSTATLNPQSLDPEYFTDKIPPRVYKQQNNILRQFEKMGFTMSMTCTPYYLKKPDPGSHLAWAESSAVVYANSILGTRTNREGGPSALASAIIGKTPNYGMHKAENRRPNITVNIEDLLKDETEFGALGILLGEILGDKIPLIPSLKVASEEKLKQLGAALATTGMVNMFYNKAKPKTQEMEKISVEANDLKKTGNSLSTTSDVKPDLVFIGCPHCSAEEIRKIAKMMDNKKVRAETEFWVCTSRHIRGKTTQDVNKIRKAGGHVLTDMCTIVSWTETLGIETIMTNSAKTAYYAPTLNKAETIFAPLKKCLETVSEG
jgi:predicted aconitase